MKTAHEILVDARAVIAEPEHWTRRAYAINNRRQVVAPNDPEACQWCTYGAVYRALGNMPHPVSAGGERLAEVLGRLNRAAMQAGANGGAITLNDNPNFGHDDVLRMFDVAIEAAKP